LISTLATLDPGHGDILSHDERICWRILPLWMKRKVAICLGLRPLAAIYAA